jgi:hypothetical protein
MRFLKKAFAIFSIFSIVNLSIAPATHAFFGLGEAIGGALVDAAAPMKDKVFEDLHISTEGTQFLSESMNVFKTKNREPQVELHFSPTNPKTGEYVKATAYASNFHDASDNKLYFTWYLKHNDGTGDGSVTINGTTYATKDGNIDWDQDGDPTEMEDYKVEAMRIAANGGWDSSNANYNGDSDEDDDGIKDIKDEVSDGTDEETNLPFGGVGVREPESGFRCYTKDPADGLFYELIEGGVSEENQPPTTTDTGSRNIYDFDIEACEICGEGVYTATVKSCTKTWNIQNTCSPMEDNDTLLWFGTDGDNLRIKIPNHGLPPGCSVCVYCDGTETACGAKTGEQIGEDDPGDYEGEDSLCEHLFPHAKGFTTGDGEFTDEEEKFWGTNPNDPDTNDDGINDEASVAGVGLKEFNWLYSKGDEIGVVVEGRSLTMTKYADGGYMVMWALPKNNFDVPETACKLKNKTLYMTTVMGVDVPIPAANFDINECLKYNFVNPSDGSQPEKLEMGLTYSPLNPRNDANGNNGDNLNFTASIENRETENSQVYYKWKIEGGSEASNNSSNWTTLSDSSDFREDTDIEYLEGLGLSTLSMTLNSPNITDYIRVSVTAEEYHSSSDVTKKGSTSAIIRVNSDSANDIKFSSNTSSSEICEDQSVCTALNNQVITAYLEGNYSNFSWTLNGTTGNYDGGGTYDKTKQENTINFPVNGSPGKIYVVTVTANNTDSNESVTSSRAIKIIDPTLTLSVSGANPKKLGTYLNLDGSEVSDESDTMFESSGGSVTVTASLNPTWMSPVPEITWTVDGVTQDTTGTSITLGSLSGNTVVTAKAVYAQSNETREILRSNWNISQFTSTEIPMEGSITIKASGEVAVSMGEKLMANVMSSLPGQMIFLFRIALTVIMVLFVSSLVLSFERNPK